MQGLLRSQSHIAVADPRPQDYRDLALLAGRHGWHVHFLTNARAAIRFSRLTRIDLCMVNISLPDMSGFDLLEMLRDKLRQTRVLLVADEYNPEDEARACGCGAALYWCKGPGPSIDCQALLTLLVNEMRPITVAEPLGEQESLAEFGKHTFR